jgi:hypothetical protein
MKKKGLIILTLFTIFFLFNITNIYCLNRYKKKQVNRTHTKIKSSLQNDYLNFANAFKNKNFNICTRYLSSKDKEKFNEVLNINNLKLNINDLLKLKLDEIWKSYYDSQSKKENILKNKNILKKYLKEMEGSLKDAKQTRASQNTINKIKQNMKRQELITKENILLLNCIIKTFGNIVDSKMIDNRAMVAVEFKYIFPKKLVKNAKKFFIKNNAKMSKVKQFKKPNTLIMYYIFAFEKEDKTWKILFFSRDEFDTSGFEEFIKGYEPGSNLAENEIDEEIGDTLSGL